MHFLSFYKIEFVKHDKQMMHERTGWLLLPQVLGFLGFQSREKFKNK